MTTTQTGRHLAAVNSPPASPPAPDVDSIVESLEALVDLGRAITARASLLLIADPELVLAGQRVEFLAGRAFALIFDAPVGTPIEQLVSADTFRLPLRVPSTTGLDRSARPTVSGFDVEVSPTDVAELLEALRRASGTYANLRRVAAGHRHGAEAVVGFPRDLVELLPPVWQAVL